MFAHERRRLILGLLRKQQRVSTKELASRLKVSPATLRRDLAQLDRSGEVMRVHGGIILRRDAIDEPSLRQKSGLAIKAKKRIAARVVTEVPQGATVFIDGGTTCLEAGLLLRKRADLVIVTNSLPLIATYDSFEAKLLVLGGERRAVSGALVGTMAIEAVARLRADVALIGASGLNSQDGPGTTELLETEIKREWIHRSGQAFLLADASKWNHGSMIRFADWSEFSAFYTDQEPPPFKSRKLRIVIA
jgi:DeoR family fructose operon transcriptional repressor